MPLNQINNLNILESEGKKRYGEHFKIYPEDREVILKLLSWFLKDANKAEFYNLDLSKGILLSGPIGCGKTSLFTLIRFLLPYEQRFAIISCRDITFNFIQEGYSVIQRYSTKAYNSGYKPITTCFDDLGTESELKYFGNQCNVMGEILLSRYDNFINDGMITHLTTNLSASELENFYGNRVRSRLREMFNLIAFESNSKDKRK